MCILVVRFLSSVRRESRLVLLDITLCLHLACRLRYRSVCLSLLSFQKWVSNPLMKKRDWEIDFFLSLIRSSFSVFQCRGEGKERSSTLTVIFSISVFLSYLLVLLIPPPLLNPFEFSVCRSFYSILISSWFSFIDCNRCRLRCVGMGIYSLRDCSSRILCPWFSVNFEPYFLIWISGNDS